MAIFETGETYYLYTKDDHKYPNAKVLDVDSHFISIAYKRDDLYTMEILNLDSIKIAVKEAADSKQYWYFHCFGHSDDPRYGISSVMLSQKAYQINKDAGLPLFTNEAAAKQYLFEQVKNGISSGPFVWENDNNALQYHKFNGTYASDIPGIWLGSLASEYKKYLGE